MNITIPRSVKDKKAFIINEVQKQYPKFTFQQTRFGNPKPGTDDMADAIVVAHSGYIDVLECQDVIGKNQNS